MATILSFDDLVPQQPAPASGGVLSFDDLIPVKAEGAPLAVTVHGGPSAAQITGEDETPMAGPGATSTRGQPSDAAAPLPMVRPDAAANADGLVRSAANGLTFGLADKAAAGMRAALGPETYDAALKDERAQSAAVPAAVRHAGEIGGNLATGLGLMKAGVTLAQPAVMAGRGLMARMGLMGAEGAGYGAADAVGHTDEGTIGERAGRAARGAVTGGEIGLALPAAGKALQVGYRAVAPFFGSGVPGAAGSGAGKMVAGAIDASRDVPGELTRLGPDAMLVDASSVLQGLGEGVGARMGEGQAILTDRLRARNLGRNERLADDATVNLGAAESPVAKTKTILDARREITGPMYRQAFENAPPVDTTDVLATIGQRLNTAEGNEKLAIQKVRNMMLDQTPTGPVPKTDAERLHNIKGEIDSLIQYGDPGLGVPAGSLNREQGALKMLRRDLNGAIERDVPGYQAANAKSAEYARYAGQVEDGTSALSGGKDAIWPADLSAKWATMTPEEQSAFRSGARADIENAVGTSANDLGALRRKVGGDQDWNRDKMGLVFGEQPTQNMVGAIDREAQFARTASDITANSRTEPRRQASDLIDRAGLPSIPVDATMMGSAARASQELLKGVAKFATGARSDAIRTELGDILSRQGPERDAVLQALMSAAAVRGARGRAIEAAVANPATLQGVLQLNQEHRPRGLLSAATNQR